jgi:phospholipase/lecithinase/hemolysin
MASEKFYVGTVGPLFTNSAGDIIRDKDAKRVIGSRQAHVADVTKASAALTDNTGGVAVGTIPPVTNAVNPGSADSSDVNTINASIIKTLNQVVADIAEIETQFNKLLTAVEAHGLVETS